MTQPQPTMHALWNALRSRFGGLRAARRRVSLQHLGLSESEASELQLVLDKVGEALALKLELQDHGGDIVLLDALFASRLSPQLVDAYTDGRPVVRVADLNGAEDASLSTLQRFEHHQQALLSQLREIDVVRRRSANAASWGASTATAETPASGFDPSFDSQLDAESPKSELERGQREMLQTVLRGAAQGDQLAYAASYGPDANLHFDFQARRVSIDPLALRQLRLGRELPQPAPGARPRSDALVRELDETVWDLGIAAGPWPLLDEPADWWHCPLRGAPAAEILRFTRLPRHLDMARRLAAGPVTPSELRRHALVSVAELRRFIQACLALHLAEWSSLTASENTTERTH